MAKSFVIGTTRLNPTTYMTEVWDGKTWNDGCNTITLNNTYPTGSTISTATSASTAVYNVRPTMSATERELMFDFLKNNMRVAEYLDENGKVHTVQLEMRAGEGFVWEQIKRQKVKNSL